MKLFKYCLIFCLISCFGCASESQSCVSNIETTILTTPNQEQQSSFNKEDYIWEEFIFSDQPINT